MTHTSPKALSLHSKTVSTLALLSRLLSLSLPPNNKPFSFRVALSFSLPLSPYLCAHVFSLYPFSSFYHPHSNRTAHIPPRHHRLLRPPSLPYIYIYMHKPLPAPFSLLGFQTLIEITSPSLRAMILTARFQACCLLSDLSDAAVRIAG